MKKPTVYFPVLKPTIIKPSLNGSARPQPQLPPRRVIRPERRSL